MLHVICTRLYPGHLSICVGGHLAQWGDCKKFRTAPFNAIIITIIIITIIININIIIIIIIIIVIIIKSSLQAEELWGFLG